MKVREREKERKKRDGANESGLSSAQTTIVSDYQTQYEGIG